MPTYLIESNAIPLLINFNSLVPLYLVLQVFQFRNIYFKREYTSANFVLIFLLRHKLSFLLYISNYGIHISEWLYYSMVVLLSKSIKILLLNNPIVNYTISQKKTDHSQKCEPLNSFLMIMKDVESNSVFTDFFQISLFPILDNFNENVKIISFTFFPFPP